jgi:putative heme-binding domain-containing protein
MFTFHVPAPTSPGIPVAHRRGRPTSGAARCLAAWRRLASGRTAAAAACAVALSGSPAAQQHAGSYTQADIERGALMYGAQCSSCHGPEGDTVPGVDLRLGRFKRGSSDEDLAGIITRGIPGTAMPSNKFTEAELSALIAYIRSMREFGARAVALGDPGTGRTLLEARGCLGCHRVNGRGSMFAADLSEIGAIRSGEALHRSLLDFSNAVAPGRRFVRAVTTEGRVVTGRRLNEDTYTVQLMDGQARLISLSKEDLREYTTSKVSPKPAGKEKLSPEDRSHLVAYLLELKGLDKPRPGSRQ